MALAAHLLTSGADRGILDKFTNVLSFLVTYVSLLCKNAIRALSAPLLQWHERSAAEETTGDKRRLVRTASALAG